MKKIGITLLLLLLMCSAIFCDEPRKAFGIMFNTEDILLNIDSFQGGIGVKYVHNLNSFRGSVGVSYSNDSSPITFTVGFGYGRYLWLSRVSPYFGGSAGGGIISQTTVTDADNWTKNITYRINGGPILGAEIFITDFLSLFAEYMVKLEINALRSGTSVDGTETWQNVQWSYVIDTSVGNNSKIGIIIYFSNLIDLPKNR